MIAPESQATRKSGALPGFVPANGTKERVGRGMHTSNVSKDEDHRLFLAKIRLDLRSAGGNGGDVCNVVAFLERWDRVDVQDDTGDGSAGFEYELAEIVGDKADFHALLNIGTALHKRVPNARAVGQDIHDSVEPDRILDGPRVPWKHFESAHGVECALDEEVDVIR